ncbi:MAG: kelch repeat-containing protein [Thermoplasmata archaeon]|nr:kelch repeat-containing protein [Thermoplasmata archaeon]
MREYASMAWDAADGYAVLFGGFGTTSTSGGPDQAFNDTWVESNGSWSPIVTPVAPPPLVAPAMAYDPNASAVILFGGWDCTVQSACWTTATNATWEFHAGTWTRLHPAASPSPRVSPSLAYDPTVGGLVLFGGYAAIGATANGTGTAKVAVNDTWTFVAGVWTNVTPTLSPSPRWQAGLSFDAKAGALYLFGGARNNAVRTPLFNDTWAFASGSWANVSRPLGPPRSAGMAFSYVSSDKAIVLFGGINNTYDFALGATWELRSGVWSRLTTNVSPPARWSTTFVDALPAGYGLLFGGNLYSPLSTSTYGGLTNDSWTFSHGNWSVLGSNASVPPPGISQMVYDAADNETVLLSSGPVGSTTSTSETWVYKADNWSIVPTPTAPSARTHAAMAYDAKDGYVLLFGGTSTGRGPFYLNDTWTFQAGNWTHRAPRHDPGAQYGAAAAYDAKDGFVLLLIGQGRAVGLAWAWNGTDWSPVTSHGSTPLGVGYVAFRIAYDPVAAYVVVTQAFNESCNGVVGNCFRTWSFVGGNWTDLTRPATLPPPLLQYALAWDAADQAVVMFGGQAGPLYNETWQFQAGVWSPVTASPAPYPRYDAAMTYDGGDGYLLLFGGFGPLSASAPTYFADTWSYNAGVWTVRIPSVAVSLASVDVGVPVHIATRSSSPTGVPTFAYTGLPLGCFSQNLPTLVCRPTAAGTYAVAVTVSYPGGTVSHAAVSLNVQPSPTIAAFQASVASLTIGNRTTLTANVAGGTAPFTFAYGGLPPGCAAANVSTLTCTPTAPGNYTIGVTATDRFGEAANASVKVVVLGLQLPPGHGNPKGGGGSGPGALGSPATVTVLVVAVAAVVLGALALAARRVRRARLRREGDELIRTMRTLDGPDDLPGSGRAR